MAGISGDASWVSADGRVFWKLLFPGPAFQGTPPGWEHGAGDSAFPRAPPAWAPPACRRCSGKGVLSPVRQGLEDTVEHRARSVRSGGKSWEGLCHGVRLCGRARAPRGPQGWLHGRQQGALPGREHSERRRLAAPTQSRPRLTSPVDPPGLGFSVWEAAWLGLAWPGPPQLGLMWRGGSEGAPRNRSPRPKEGGGR